VTTVGGALAAKWVIHAVGPAFSDEANKQNWEEEDSQLKAAYRNAVREAVGHGCKSLGISLLSAGIFRGGRGLHAVLMMACEAVSDALKPPLEEVYLIGFTKSEVRRLLEAAAAVIGQDHEQPKLKDAKDERFLPKLAAQSKKEGTEPISNAVPPKVSGESCSEGAGDGERSAEMQELAMMAEKSLREKIPGWDQLLSEEQLAKVNAEVQNFFGSMPQGSLTQSKSSKGEEPS